MLKKVLVLGLLVALCMMIAPAMADEPSITGIEAVKTATPFWENVITYDWTVDKTADTEEIEAKSGETESLHYTVAVTREKASEVERWGVRGTITVTNTGSNPTQGLKIVDQMMYQTTGKGGTGGFVDLAGATQTIIPDAQLAPGETKTFDYEIFFTPITGAKYKNTAKVTITNHDAAHMGQDVGPTANTDAFAMPASRTTIEIDNAASLADEINCPDGFTCEYEAGTSWPKALSGSETITYAVDVTNDGAPCDTTFELTNAAALKACTSGREWTDGVTVTIDTGTCPQFIGLSHGFWKTHSRFGPAKPNEWPAAYDPDDLVSGIFTVPVGSVYGSTTLHDALWLPGGGMNALLREAVAALLNDAYFPNDEYPDYIYGYGSGLYSDGFEESTIIEDVNAAFAGEIDIEELKDALEYYNTQFEP